jgi:hypothetical protein
MSIQSRLPILLLLLGDALAILVVTLIGFTTHGLSTATPRWLTTFIPLLISWFLLAPWFGVFLAANYCRPLQTWRAALAIAFAAPLAALLRSVWLGNGDCARVCLRSRCNIIIGHFLMAVCLVFYV